MSSVEEKAIKKAKAKEAKAKKAAAAVKTGEKGGKPGPVRTSGRKPKISKEMDIDLGDKYIFPQMVAQIWPDLLRSN